MKKQIGTIDMTPTWQGILPGLLLVLENGTEVGKGIAREELINMAKAADAAVAMQKEKEDRRTAFASTPDEQEPVDLDQTRAAARRVFNNPSVRDAFPAASAQAVRLAVVELICAEYESIRLKDE